VALVAQQGQSVTPLIIWIGAFVVLLVIGAVVLTAVRRRLLGERERDAGAGLSLHDLREMHARGDLSDEEFARAKAAVLGSAGGAAPAPGERRAAPGFDLAGDPLPGSGDGPGGNEPRR